MADLGTNVARVTEILESPANRRRRRWRLVKDRLVGVLVGSGGVAVIVALVLIFVYLLYVVLPLFSPARIETLRVHPMDDLAPAMYLAVEEQAELGLHLGADGTARFFRLRDGAPVDVLDLTPVLGGGVTAVAETAVGGGLLALGGSGGGVAFAAHRYTVTYPGDKRLITPGLEWPYGTQVLPLLAPDTPVRRLAAGAEADTLMVVAGSGDRELIGRRMTLQTSLMDDTATLEEVARWRLHVADGVAHVALDGRGRLLYVVRSDGLLEVYDVTGRTTPVLLDSAPAVAPSQQVTAARMLLGGISLLVADDGGGLTQWFVARGPGEEHTLERVRGFSQAGAITHLAPELRRKGIVTVTADGRVGVFHATAERSLLDESIGDERLRRVAASPRGDRLLVEDEGGRIHVLALDNPHPEVSWSALWHEVWYENHDEPKYMWQSSAAANDFEPKFSLVPLTFGTLKAAFYAMLIAAPLAVLGAIYTAHFMDRRIRGYVKPAIEVMEALPTVILGFLAGLWFAPFVEDNLPGLLALVMLLPVAVIAFGYGWGRLPEALRHRVPEGWYVVLMVPLLVGVTALALALSHPLEVLLFDGDVRQWLSARGIDFDQRNAIVVGLAMGFAVIPTIFSIAEDAIFGVPRHLSHGSLALGATTWQTLYRVVLLTASPGIFSALMIGLGRAVGETMIVLMATGNTPVMDLSIFQGMRTLAANIAVEMPESEVDSTHYRVLFLAGLVLFLFTFMVNTGAEIVRQRLRRRYSSL